MSMNNIEKRELCSGIFWVISDSTDLHDYKLIVFNIPCDINGNIIGVPVIPLNAKSGLTYNHKKLWEDVIQRNSEYKPYNKKSYDYYPRGRVDVANNQANVYLNPHINRVDIRTEIKFKFGINANNISKVRFAPDGSAHYECWLDKKE